MKSFVFTAALLLSSWALAETTLLKCDLQAEMALDLDQIEITQSEGGLTLVQTLKNRTSVATGISETQWNSQNIRLANTRDGFRWLRYEYSDFFRETNWFVTTQGAGFRSVARANCE
ncbi:MAG: hypothetical protein ACK5UJ_04385 [Pseudobdellovibrionaceae bacterium]